MTFALTPEGAVGIAVITAILAALAVDAFAERRAARAERLLLDGGHDVEYAPAAGRLIHHAGCWCRYDWALRARAANPPPPVPSPHPMDPGHPPADFED